MVLYGEQWALTSVASSASPGCSPYRHEETVGKSASVASGGDGPLLCVRVCACVRAHIGARKIVSKILIMRYYWSFPIGNRTAVLLYCLFYLPKISVVYCHLYPSPSELYAYKTLLTNLCR